MRLLFIGPPGSGKGTQAAVLESRFSIPQISTGDILRDQVQKQSLLGKKVEKLMAEGALVPDDLVIENYTWTPRAGRWLYSRWLP